MDCGQVAGWVFSGCCDVDPWAPTDWIRFQKGFLADWCGSRHGAIGGRSPVNPMDQFEPNGITLYAQGRAT